MVRRYIYSTDEYNVRNYSSLFLGGGAGVRITL